VHVAGDYMPTIVHPTGDNQIAQAVSAHTHSWDHAQQVANVPMSLPHPRRVGKTYQRGPDRGSAGRTGPKMSALPTPLADAGLVGKGAGHLG
jgi:hypothetical protein